MDVVLVVVVQVVAVVLARFGVLLMRAASQYGCGQGVLRALLNDPRKRDQLLGLIPVEGVHIGHFWVSCRKRAGLVKSDHTERPRLF